jgi:hypothetical protein
LLMIKFFQIIERITDLFVFFFFNHLEISATQTSSINWKKKQNKKIFWFFHFFQIEFWKDFSSTIFHIGRNFSRIHFHFKWSNIQQEKSLLIQNKTNSFVFFLQSFNCISLYKKFSFSSSILTSFLCQISLLFPFLIFIDSFRRISFKSDQIKHFS